MHKGYACFKFCCCLSSESELCSKEKGWIPTTRHRYLPEKGNENLATYCRNYMQTTDYRRQKHMSFKKCYVSIVSTRKLLHDQNSKNVE
jgi:hypothetical protein